MYIALADKSYVRRKDMGYIENNLGKDEKVLACVKHTWAGLIGSVIANAIIVTIFCLLIYFVTTWLPIFLIGLSGGSIDSVEGMKEMYDLYDILMAVRGVLIGFIIAIACIKVLFTAISIRCNKLIVTNKRLFGRKGVISRSIIDIVLLKLDTINSHNGILGAIFHYGTLEVVSAGSQKVVGGQSINMTFPYVKNTEEFRRAVLDAIDTAKEADRQAQAEAQAAALKRAQESL